MECGESETVGIAGGSICMFQGSARNGQFETRTSQASVATSKCETATRKRARLARTTSKRDARHFTAWQGGGCRRKQFQP